MERITGKIVLRTGRAKPIKNRHPWIFSGAVERTEGNPGPGDLVSIHDHGNNYLAIGYYNPASQILARVLTWDSVRAIDESFWRERIKTAVKGRALLSSNNATDSFRLIFAESDGLPGLIVDRYGEYLVLQCLTLGIDQRKEMLVQMLVDLLKPVGIFERSDGKVRKKEGLSKIAGLLHGKSPPVNLIIKENGRQFLVDVHHGHKTGFYLDQRYNRALLMQPKLVARKSLLNVFSYTGGFSVYAASAEAGKITNVDSSIPVLELAERNIALNGFNRSEDEYLAGDAFEVLRHLLDNSQDYDIVIMDPPKFVHSRKNLTRASRGYKDLNLLGMRLLCRGGLMLTFSCSGLVSEELFQRIIFAAALDSGRDVQIIQRLGQSSDHPVAVTFPEAAYLKGFICRVW
ncbi:MAG: class I SAM-dependent methyltransferase [Candidatus Promineifilaceae bacterium]|nr:class I SAM-dependent methyltransferase [Candidatus Promineifilaceae bacterium]